MIIKNSQETFKNIQLILQPNSTIEVGAAEAQFSVDMLEVLDHDNIWAVEANPCLYFKYNYERKDDFIEGIKYENLIISDHDGVETFLFQGKERMNLNETNSILWRKNYYDDKVAEEYPCLTLDSYVVSRNIPKNYSLWIDVEGANKHVLSGATETLKNTLSIHIEVEKKEIWEGQWIEDDVVKFLENLDFVQVAYQDHESQKDLIYIKKELISDKITTCLMDNKLSLTESSLS